MTSSWWRTSSIGTSSINPRFKAPADETTAHGCTRSTSSAAARSSVTSSTAASTAGVAPASAAAACTPAIWPWSCTAATAR
jgi:hypothetical protein